MTNEQRIKIERRIVHRYIKAVEDAGYTIERMNTGDDYENKPYNKADLFEADECHLYIKGGAGKAQWMFFVYGNEPGEVLNDYTVGLEDAIKPVNAYAERWA